MIPASNHVPDDKDALKAALIDARAKLSGAEAMIAHLQLVIAKMKREMFGPRSERSQRLIEQMELQRSEEHTSELQSLTNLVCRLLLEKKKNKRSAFIAVHYTWRTGEMP